MLPEAEGRGCRWQWGRGHKHYPRPAPHSAPGIPMLCQRGVLGAQEGQRRPGLPRARRQRRAGGEQLGLVAPGAPRPSSQPRGALNKQPVVTSFH